jgi:hypothetical protein
VAAIMLDERPDEFDTRNLFFGGLLGLLSALDRLDTILTAEPSEGAPVPEDDPVLMCALGLVAFRLRLRQHLQKLEHPDEAPPAPKAPRPPLRDLLR